MERVIRRKGGAASRATNHGGEGKGASYLNDQMHSLCKLRCSETGKEGSWRGTSNRRRGRHADLLRISDWSSNTQEKEMQSGEVNL